MTIKDWAEAHASELYNSKTVRALLIIEGGALAAFFKGIVDGSQPLTVQSFEGWALLQAGIIVAYFIRHTLAGIELKLNGMVDPSIVKSIEAGAVTTLVTQLEQKKPELATAIKAHLNDQS